MSRYSQDLPSDDVFGDGSVPSSSRNRTGINITSLLLSVGPDEELENLRSYIVEVRTVRTEQRLQFQTGYASLTTVGSASGSRGTGVGTSTATAQQDPAWQQSLRDTRIPISDVAIMAAADPGFNEIVDTVQGLVDAGGDLRTQLLLTQLQTLENQDVRDVREATRFTIFRLGQSSARRPSSSVDGRSIGHRRTDSVFLIETRNLPITLPNHLIYGDNVTAEQRQPQRTDPRLGYGRGEGSGYDGGSYASGTATGVGRGSGTGFGGDYGTSATGLGGGYATGGATGFGGGSGSAFGGGSNTAFGGGSNTAFGGGYGGFAPSGSGAYGTDYRLDDASAYDDAYEELLYDQDTAPQDPRYRSDYRSDSREWR